MGLKVFNSLSRQKEEFVPAEEGRVRMYVCGPTVYAPAHIGHARSAVSFDVIYRYLKYRGYEVTYARNYTDVDDKIIARANELGLESAKLAEDNIEAFDSDMGALGVLLPPIRPKATETMAEIIELAGDLIKKGFAYELEGDVYFAVRKLDDYGKLSGKNIDDLEAGARVDVDSRKRDPLDFALWKAAKEGEPSWESPWGRGRPGWHIECSCMCMKWLGKTIDIHGGGKDLIFPHHENEIAQSEAATGQKPFVKYWLHNGFVNIDKVKMSKSLGNILNIHDALGSTTGEAIRFFLLSNHYRSPVDYSAESLKEAGAAMERFYKTVERIHIEGGPNVKKAPEEGNLKKRLAPVIEAMDDDFNTAGLIGLLFKEITRANRILDNIRDNDADGSVEENQRELALILTLFKEAGSFLGLFTTEAESYLNQKKDASKVDAQEIELLIEERKKARQNKDFKKADEIRKSLLEQGIELEDNREGTRWSLKTDA
ncbi:MAG: cysteine--tRNA ligase [Thermodesulfobacteriota bacterium]